MTNTDEQVTKFITTLQNEYPRLKIDYDYDPEEDYYYIKHNNSNLQFNNEDFPQFAGRQIRTYFFNHNIFNISFGYDHSYFKSTNYQIQTNYKHITIEMNKLNLTTNLLYKSTEASIGPLLINNKPSNITFSLDVTDSLEASYNRQAYSTNQNTNPTYYNNDLRSVS